MQAAVLLGYPRGRNQRAPQDVLSGSHAILRPRRARSHACDAGTRDESAPAHQESGLVRDAG